MIIVTSNRACRVDLRFKLYRDCASPVSAAGHEDHDEVLPVLHAGQVQRRRPVTVLGVRVRALLSQSQVRSGSRDLLPRSDWLTWSSRLFSLNTSSHSTAWCRAVRSFSLQQGNSVSRSFRKDGMRKFNLFFSSQASQKLRVD